jgi:hypothetical protein
MALQMTWISLALYSDPSSHGTVSRYGTYPVLVGSSFHFLVLVARCRFVALRSVCRGASDGFSANSAFIILTLLTLVIAGAQLHGQS